MTEVNYAGLGSLSTYRLLDDKGFRRVMRANVAGLRREQRRVLSDPANRFLPKLVGCPSNGKTLIYVCRSMRISKCKITP